MIRKFTIEVELKENYWLATCEELPRTYGASGESALEALRDFISQALDKYGELTSDFDKTMLSQQLQDDLERLTYFYEDGFTVEDSQRKLTFR